MSTLIKALFSRGLIAPSALLRTILLLALLALTLTLGYSVLRQFGYDARTITVTDMKTGQAKTYRLVSVLPRDAIPAITNPSFAPAREAKLWMERTEQVIGLEIGGENKAYPINVLSRHEIVDDVVGGKPVAVTW